MLFSRQLLLRLLLPRLLLRYLLLRCLLLLHLLTLSLPYAGDVFSQPWARAGFLLQGRAACTGAALPQRLPLTCALLALLLLLLLLVQLLPAALGSIEASLLLSQCLDQRVHNAATMNYFTLSGIAGSSISACTSRGACSIASAGGGGCAGSTTTTTTTTISSSSSSSRTRARASTICSGVDGPRRSFAIAARIAHTAAEECAQVCLSAFR